MRFTFAQRRLLQYKRAVHPQQPSFFSHLQPPVFQYRAVTCLIPAVGPSFCPPLPAQKNLTIYYQGKNEGFFYCFSRNYIFKYSRINKCCTVFCSRLFLLPSVRALPACLRLIILKYCYPRFGVILFNEDFLLYLAKKVVAGRKTTGYQGCKQQNCYTY